MVDYTNPTNRINENMSIDYKSNAHPTLIIDKPVGETIALNFPSVDFVEKPSKDFSLKIENIISNINDASQTTIDELFSDSGCYATKNYDWTITPYEVADMIVNDEYTTLTSNNGEGLASPMIELDKYDGVYVEFDYIHTANTGNSVKLMFVDNWNNDHSINNEIGYTLSEIGVDRSGKIKMICLNNKLDFYLDNNKLRTLNWTLDDDFRFYISFNSCIFKFSNFLMFGLSHDFIDSATSTWRNQNSMDRITDGFHFNNDVNQETIRYDESSMPEDVNTVKYYNDKLYNYKTVKDHVSIEKLYNYNSLLITDDTNFIADDDSNMLYYVSRTTQSGMGDGYQHNLKISAKIPYTCEFVIGFDGKHSDDKFLFFDFASNDSVQKETLFSSFSSMGIEESGKNYYMKIVVRPSSSSASEMTLYVKTDDTNEYEEAYFFEFSTWFRIGMYCSNQYADETLYFNLGDLYNIYRIRHLNSNGVMVSDINSVKINASIQTNNNENIDNGYTYHDLNKALILNHIALYHFELPTIITDDDYYNNGVMRFLDNHTQQTTYVDGGKYVS